MTRRLLLLVLQDSHPLRQSTGRRPVLHAHRGAGDPQCFGGDLPQTQLQQSAARLGAGSTGERRAVGRALLSPLLRLLFSLDSNTLRRVGERRVSILRES